MTHSAPYGQFVVASLAFTVAVLSVIAVVAKFVWPHVSALVLPGNYALWGAEWRLAFLEIAVLVVGGWAWCMVVHGQDSWTFDSFGWPLSPVYAVLYYAGEGGDATRQQAALLLALLFAIRLNANYFRAEG